MSDLISRQDAIDAINELTYPSSLVDVKRVIQALPSVQPERKTGLWIEASEDERNQIVWLECSECGQPMSWHSNYCPNCGADMRGDQDDSISN